jgi:hypothetical protein
MDLSRVSWRKASYSNSNGGECVEVGTAWRKDSNSNGACIEAGSLVAVRDSKDLDGPSLAFRPQEWSTFTHRVKAGAYDLG